MPNNKSKLLTFKGNHKQQRARKSSVASNIFYSGGEDSEDKDNNNIISQRFDKIEKQQQAMNMALLHIHEAII